MTLLLVPSSRVHLAGIVRRDRRAGSEFYRGSRPPQGNSRRMQNLQQGITAAQLGEWAQVAAVCALRKESKASCSQSPS